MVYNKILPANKKSKVVLEFHWCKNQYIRKKQTVMISIFVAKNVTVNCHSQVSILIKFNNKMNKVTVEEHLAMSAYRRPHKCVLFYS